MKVPESLGERSIIEIIQNHLTRMPRMSVPFGDDVSAYDVGNGKLAVLKTDMLVDKTDMPQSMSLWQAARKAVVMNVSDFAAKCVQPLVMLVSLGLPRGTNKSEVEELGEGLNAGTRDYGAYIIGGDTSETSDIIICLSVFGIAKKNELRLRSGARPGDVLAVTGLFGKTSAGLRILLDGVSVSRKLRKALVEPVLMPRARLAEGLALGRVKAVTASIDSSDGLAWSLHELAKSSGVGFVVDHLPVAGEAVSFARKNRLNPVNLALYGGEEYELVVTITPRLRRKAEQAIAKVGGTLTQIGRVTAERNVVLVTKKGRFVIEPRGYEHFKSGIKA